MNKELILASGSPRRKELLQQLHIPFSVHVSNVDEKVNHNYSPSEVVMDLALQKASDVATLYPNHIVLGSDTVVVYKDSILGKPASEAEAVKTLEMLSGKNIKCSQEWLLWKVSKFRHFMKKQMLNFGR